MKQIFSNFYVSSLTPPNGLTTYILKLIFLKLENYLENVKKIKKITLIRNKYQRYFNLDRKKLCHLAYLGFVINPKNINKFTPTSIISAIIE